MKRSKKKENLNDLHPLGMAGMFEIYGGCGFVRKPSFYIAFAITLVLFFFLLLNNNESLSVVDLIGKIVGLGLDLDGGLIGLTLAGLTLMVTFGSDKLLKHIVKTNLEKAVKDKKFPGFSSYQSAVAKFGFAVFVQVITLITLFAFSFVLELEISLESEWWNKFFNALFLSIAVFLILYSLFLVVQMTINIFTISQMNHSVYSVDAMKEIEEKQLEEKNENVE